MKRGKRYLRAVSSLNKQVIGPYQTIGIIGGGQLGRMMALAAKASGFKIAVLDPTLGCPCGQVADYQITGAYDDLASLRKLSEISDVITYEFENVSAEALEWLKEHANLPQGTELLKISQDRLQEKTAIKAAGVPVAPYYPVYSFEDIYDSIDKLGYPVVLKTVRGGYDGKGQFVIRDESDITKASILVENGACVLEAWVPFVKEISVIMTRKANGDLTHFPVAENIHQNNILHLTIVPARITQEAEQKAVLLARKLAEELNLVGTLAVEMFLTETEELIVNELAPRPHNSGHFTIEACETSQFEQHVRAICNWPLASTTLLKPVVMANLLGEHLDGALSAITEQKDWKFHLYGKEEAKSKRKMGHITLLRPTIKQALAELEASGIWKHQVETEEIK